MSSSKTTARKSVYLVLNNIRSAHNVGSIFRTADAAGVARIYLCGITPVPGNPKSEILNSKQIQNSKFKILNSSAKIAKTALGAEKYVPWEYRRDAWRLLKELKTSGFLVLALEQASKSRNVFAYKPKKNKPLALIVGNEVRGLSPQILKYCDVVAEIPMYGKKESLNVSVATGIALYRLIQNKNRIRHTVIFQNGAME